MSEDHLAITGKAVIVTGAAGGIGYAICEALAAVGAKVGMLDIDETALEAAAEKLRAGGAEAAPARVDLSKADAIVPAVEAVRAAFGPIAGLVNNAGILQLKTLADTTAADFDLTLAINLRAPFLLIQETSKDMIATGGGKIVSIASSAGKTGGSAAQGVYGASKAAVTAITKSWAKELAPHSIGVNSISPALIETPMIKGLEQFAKLVPLGRLGRPSEVADAVLFLMSDRASFITGEDLDVNGGFLMD